MLQNNNPPKFFKTPVNLKKSKLERRIQRLDNFNTQQKALGRPVDDFYLKDRIEG